MPYTTLSEDPILLIIFQNTRTIARGPEKLVKLKVKKNKKP